MIENNSGLKERIRKIINDFFIEQLSETATSISVVLLHDMITIFCEGCFAPAELKLAKEKMQFNLLKQLKEQELERVFPDLKILLEGVIGNQILRFDSIVGIEGTRLIQITLSENLGKKKK